MSSTEAACCVGDWNNDEAVDREPSLPPLDPDWRAEDLDALSNRRTEFPSFHPEKSADEESAEDRPTENHLRAAPVEGPESSIRARAYRGEVEDEEFVEEFAAGRRMYSAYLASDFPAALALSNRVLEREPGHAIAQLVAARCRERLRWTSVRTCTLTSSSIVGVNFAEIERHATRMDTQTARVVGQVDGLCDIATVAALSGCSAPEALERLRALLELGFLELVG